MYELEEEESVNEHSKEKVKLESSIKAWYTLMDLFCATLRVPQN